MTTRTRRITVAEFQAMPEAPGHRYELVDGELVDMDGGPKHSIVSNAIGRLLGNHVVGTGLALYIGNSGGFQIDAYTLRFPDVHVTSWERMAGYDEAEGGWPRFAPDVAIEVVSPSNTPGVLARKTAEYFAGGARAVWIAHPEHRTVAVRRPGVAEQAFGSGDILYGDPEIAGFACPVADIFVALDQFERRAGS